MILQYAVPLMNCCFYLKSIDYAESMKLVEKIESKQKLQRETMPYMEIAVGTYVRYDIRQPEKEAIQQADQNMYTDKKRRKAK